jgi:VWFA-related protein
MNRLVYDCIPRVARLALLAALLLSGVVGQSPMRAQAQAADIIVTLDEVDTSAYPTVRLRVVVRDRNGVPIADLPPESFEIVEDGAAVFPPTAVTMESSPQAQVSVGIVIDMYKTLAGRPIEAAQAATNELLDDLLAGGNEDNRAAFVGVHKGISTDPNVLHEDYEVPFTNDRNRLLNVINFIDERMEDEPGTPLYDAVIKAVRMAAATEPVGHRALIVMTDGEDRTSLSTDSDTIQTAISQQTPVFAIGLSNSRLNEQYLRRLADQTGGTYQAAQTPDDFSSLFANVLTMLRTQYVLTHDASLPEDGLPHSLLVHVRTPTGLEGFAERRFTTPGVAATATAVDEETDEEPAATPQPTQAATPVPSPEPESEGGSLDIIRTFVQENMLLAILIVAAVALLFLIVVIVVIILIRRRRTVEEEGLPPIPEAPFAPQPFEALQPDTGVPTDWPDRPYVPEFPPAGATATPTSAPGVEPAPRYGTVPTAPAGGPFAPAPPLPTPAPAGPAPAAAGGTRILDRGPKMPVVGLLIGRGPSGRRFDVSKAVTTIGRGQGNDVVIDDATVSRQHATIRWEQERFRVYDLGSSNGTFVDDQRVREPVVLWDGATVRFGAVELVFKLVSLGT